MTSRTSFIPLTHFAARLILAGVFALLFSQTAAAQLTFVDDTGSPVADPAVLDATNEAVYFTDTATTNGGIYEVTNNTTDYGLIAFGISNAGTSAYFFNVGNTFECDGNGMNFWCYESLELDATNWDLEGIDFFGNTGFDIFGIIDNVLDPADDTLNFYRAADGELRPGDTWDGFIYDNGMPQGQLFVVLDGPGGTLYGSGGLAVPEPGLGALLVTGIGGLLMLGRRR